MKIRRDPDWGLTIDPETVRLFADKARAIAAEMRDDYVDGGEHEVELDGQAHDSHRHDGLAEEKTEDLTQEELRELLADLNEDEMAELVALVWLGRGDYQRGEWASAVEDARQRHGRKAGGYLLGMPHLAEWLEDGLETLGA
ncbi:MAG: DUF3775 domain-containing protein [Rhizobiales bacterium]|nr:DUF3775 domain-containing protein [Hyphomicrobiales bacterium]